MNKSNLYNINDYSDKELYEILDLNNPSDRELEAKILMMIHKYEQSEAKSSKKLVEFFESIYNHFFDDSEDEDEEEDDMKEGFEEKNSKTQIRRFGEIAPSVKENMEEKEESKEESKKESKKESKEKSDGGVGYTKEVSYAQGSLNPILKQTKKRIISIDSQYRTDKRTFPTEFTFNLSEPLRDVVSLKLYSVQIPFTWYTISKTYGSNFFYFKGNVAGINNESHDIQVDISAGNYTPIELANNINGSLERKAAFYTDTNFNTTDVSYNKFTSLTKLTLDVDKIYNENNFSLTFPVTGIDDLSLSPYLIDASRNLTIPAYLGFQTKTYTANTLKTLPGSTPVPDASFYITNSTTVSDTSKNNFFTVYKYISTTDFNINTSTVDLSFDVSMSLVDASYTRTQIVENINTQIANNYYLTESFLKRTNVESYNNSSDSFYELKVKPNRFRCSNKENSKIAVVFPENTKIWYGENTCFEFENRINEMNEIISEKPAIVQTDKFAVKDVEEDQIQVHITPNIRQFSLDPSINDMSFSVPYVDNGYSLSNLMSTINTTIRDGSYNTVLNYNTDNSGVNFRSEEVSQDPSGTYAYIDNENRFNFKLDIVKDISMGNYEIDLSGTIIANNLGRINDNTTNFGTLASTMVLNNFFESYTLKGSESERVIDLSLPLIKVRTRSDATQITTGDISDNFILFLPDASSSYTNYAQWQRKVNSFLTNYIDPFSGLNFFTTQNVGLDEDGNKKFLGDRGVGTGPGDGDDLSLNIQLNKKLITRNYNIQFMDISGSIATRAVDFNSDNTWRDALKLDNSACFTSFDDKKFDLSYAVPTSGTTTILNQLNLPVAIIDSSGAFKITGTEVVPISNVITITNGVNDEIKITAIDEGVVSTGGENDITLKVPSGAYTRTTLINAINSQITTFNNNSTTKLSGKCELLIRNNFFHVNFNLTILRKYLPKDFVVVFFDNVSFAQCSAGSSSVKNTTWDSTLGWVLGFRNFTAFDMGSVGIPTFTNAITIEGDTGVSTNLYNYFLLTLDDFNQNHLNDGLVTITDTDTSIPLPSYANRSEFQCDPVTGDLVYNPTTGLTEKQIYAATEIANSKNASSSIGSSVSAKSYGSGPFVKDVFALIPLKVSGLQSGASFSEFGGTLQNQERSYFGPVNIQRMTARLLTDRGDLVDLNNANWSFSIIAEQLNKLNPE